MSPSVETFCTASAAAKFAERKDKRTPPRPERVNVCNFRRQYDRDALNFGGLKRNKQSVNLESSDTLCRLPEYQE